MDAFKTLGRTSLKCILTGSIVLSANLWAFTPTAAQIAQFKNLSPAQQKQLAKSYGIDLPSGKSAAKIEQPETPSVVKRAESVSEPEVVEPKETVVVKAAKDLQVKETKLKRFGYDLFAAAPTTFAQVADTPVPSNYTLGPGDTIKVQLFGKTSDQFELVIDRDGNVDFPELGPISLAGQTFSEVRQTLTTRVKEQMIGVRTSITMGSLRSIQVFVLGDAQTPGLYTISALSNISHALYQSGGLAYTGSLRHIQLKRNGKLVTELDLYDLLLKGDTSNDARLLPGDVVFVPPTKGAVAVDGEVIRPAIYEVKRGETVKDLLRMAGGLLPDAYPKKSVLTGFDQEKIKQITSLDLTQQSSLNRLVKSGDYIEVRSAKSSVDNGVLLMGAVSHPGFYAYAEGMRVSDVLPSIEASLLSGADLEYALVVTEHPYQSRISVRQFNLRDALSHSDSKENLKLGNRDRVIIFNRLGVVAESESSQAEDLMNLSSATPAERRTILAEAKSFNRRERLNAEDLMSLSSATPAERRTILAEAKSFSRRELLNSVIRRLTQQSKPGELTQTVSITGAVKVPGTYPLPLGAKLTDLIVAAGGMTESADVTKAEISRTQIQQGNIANYQHFSVDYSIAISDAAKNPELQAKDVIHVMTVPEWRDNPEITIKGEVKYPGTYTLKRGETIMDVFARAGGFTDFADIDGVIFTRDSIRQRQKEQLNKLGQQLRKQLASISLRVSNGANSVLSEYETMQQLITDMSEAEPVGRLVVDMPGIIRGEQEYNLILENGDALYVPPKRSSVNVIGEVQLEGTHLFKNSFDMKDYLVNSGGLKSQADVDRIYIVKSSGEVVMPKAYIPFVSANASIDPGDTIVVPIDLEYMDNLTLWGTVTGILYNTAVAVAAIGSL